MKAIWSDDLDMDCVMASGDEDIEQFASINGATVITYTVPIRPSLKNRPNDVWWRFLAKQAGYTPRINCERTSQGLA